jgi:hypothetical protein
VLHWSGKPFGSAAVTNDGPSIYYCAPGPLPGAGFLSPVELRIYHVVTGATSKTCDYQRTGFCELAMSGRELLVDVGTDSAAVTHGTRYNLTTGKVSPVPLRRAWIGLAAW